MKKKKKKNKKKIKVQKKVRKKARLKKKIKRILNRRTKTRKKIIKRKKKIKIKKNLISRKPKFSKETFRKIIRFGDRFKFKIKIKLDIDKTLQNFFQGIADKINSFKQVIEEEKERKVELRKFIREEQAQVRKDQAEKQRLFYEKIKLEKKIEQFRKREALEIKSLEKIVLKQERENYEEVQARIEKIKIKYQAIRDQKIRERIEQLGIEVSDDDSRSDLLEKERQFNIAREKIENNLESFYRSMASCIFQLNRRWLPKKMSLLRVIDRRYETSEIFIKLDEEVDENWIMLVYLKDNDPNSNIVVEDKTNPNNNQSNEYKPNEIFKFSDALVDSLTSMIDREYKKKLN